MTDQKPAAPSARDALLQTRGLNLGSGPHYAEGWVNVDLYDPPDESRPPDVKASVFDLDETFPEDSFVAAYVGHFLEHLEWSKIPEALEQIRRVVQPGGHVMFVGPCILRAALTRQPDWLLQAILAHPGEEPTGHGHAWTSTADLMLEAVQTVFEDAFLVPIVSVVPPAWPNPTTATWQAAVQATA